MAKRYEDEKVEEESTEARGFPVKDYQYDYEKVSKEAAQLREEVQKLCQEISDHLSKLHMLDAYRLVVRDVLKGLKDA